MYTEYPKRSNHIFTLGNIGVGKSSVLASLCRFVDRSRVSQLNFYPFPGEEGYRFLRDNWLDMFTKNSFPIKSRAGEFYQIRVGIHLIEPDVELKLTFQEIAGEDLLLFDKPNPEPGREVEIQRQIITYLKACNVIFMVTTPDTFNRDDPFFSYFFTRLKFMKIKKPIALIINKCDTIGEDIDDIEEYLLKEMPSTAKRIKELSKNNIPTQVFFYSTAIPQPGKKAGDIMEYRYPMYAPKILNWLFNTLHT